MKIFQLSWEQMLVIACFVQCPLGVKAAQLKRKKDKTNTLSLEALSKSIPSITFNI